MSRSTSVLRRELYRYVDTYIIRGHQTRIRRDRKSLKLHGHQVANRHVIAFRARKSKLREKAFQNKINPILIANKKREKLFFAQ